MQTLIIKELKLQSEEKKIWLAIRLFVSLIGLLLIFHVGRFLILIYPIGSIFIGLLLFYRRHDLYISFTLWLWFLTPLIRRLVDYQSGALTSGSGGGAIDVTPGLITLISLITFIKYFPKINRIHGLPFLLCIIPVFYGICTGIIQIPIKNFLIVQLALSWIGPPLFCFHIFANWRDYLIVRQTVLKTFFWTVLILGVYGVVQFVTTPAWDAFFLTATDLGARGTPEPFGIRVWSTAEAPQIFATIMMAGFIVLLSQPHQRPLNFLVMSIGFLAFALSLARTAWMAWLIGMAVFISLLKPNRQAQILISILIGALLILPLISIEPFSSVIHDRLLTLSDPTNDGSLNARQRGYELLLSQAFSQPIGIGITNVQDIDTGDTGYSMSDGSILPIFFMLGWLGGIPYCLGLIQLILNLWIGPSDRSDTFLQASLAIVLGIISTIAFNPIVNGSNGIIFWFFIGVALSAKKYNFMTS